jgi:NAD+ kinase
MSAGVVLTHTQPEQTSAALADTIAAAERAGWTLLVGEDEREKHGELVAELESAEGAKPDLCIVLGGDGTVLKGLREYGTASVPVFGFNFGTVGFLAAVEREDLAGGLERAFGGEFEVVAMPGLEVEVAGNRALALNDVSLTRRPYGRVAELSYSLGGEEVGHVRCDGLVAATPPGSTGYNLANQGPILAWGVEGYVVSFIAPHTLTSRPLVIAPNDELSVTNAAGRDAVDIVLDGEPGGELASGAEMLVRFRDAMASLAQLEGATFYRRIREKFGRLTK